MYNGTWQLQAYRRLVVLFDYKQDSSSGMQRFHYSLIGFSVLGKFHDKNIYVVILDCVHCNL